VNHWKSGGRLLNAYTTPSQGNVITALALDDEWILVGQSNGHIHVFDAWTGDIVRTLKEHSYGVWAVSLVSRGGKMSNSHNTAHDAALYTGEGPRLGHPIWKAVTSAGWAYR